MPASRHLVARLLKTGRGDLPNRAVIVDDEDDGLAVLGVPGGAIDRARLFRGCIVLTLGTRQVDLDRGAFPDDRVDADAAPGLLHEAEHLSEPEP